MCGGQPLLNIPDDPDDPDDPLAFILTTEFEIICEISCSMKTSKETIHLPDVML